MPVGGRLGRFKAAWTFSPWSSSIVSNGLGWGWKRRPPRRRRRFYQEPTPFLTDYVAELLSKKVAKRVRSIKFQGRLFCVPKKNTTKMRVILDLSFLNRFIRCDRFRMLTVAQLRTLLPQGTYGISIDLTDAYWHVPMARKFSRYLGFVLGRQAYAFTSMPFGLNIAPRIFTKLGDAVVQELRRRGINVAAYLDDWLIWAPSAAQCLESGRLVIEFLSSLGFVINYRKSRLVPQQRFNWLGLTWDLVAHTLCVPEAKRLEIARAVRTLTSCKLISRRQQERILGSLQFVSVTDKVLKARLKDIGRVWCHRSVVHLRDKRSPIPVSLLRQLLPWTSPQSLSRSVPLRPPPPSVTVHTDASLSGWGGHSGSIRLQGSWSLRLQSCHINVLEAMAVLLTLKRLGLPRGVHVRLMLDNNAIVHCINRCGSKSKAINHVVLAILQFCRKADLFLTAFHIAGVRNVVADSLSRTRPLESEWCLDERSFRFILNLVPDLEVDLFATAENYRLPVYVSPNVDPQAVATNAMVLDWNQWSRVYLFPPVNLLMKVLDKLRLFRGKAALVAPMWPKSSWFPLLQELCFRSVPLPHAVLSQTVQKDVVFASSWLTRNLHLWTS